jgi:hypothetical protein
MASHFVVSVVLPLAITVRLSDVWVFEKRQPGLSLNKDMKMIEYSKVHL